jgi:hypothetical protein
VNGLPKCNRATLSSRLLWSTKVKTSCGLADGSGIVEGAKSPDVLLGAQVKRGLKRTGEGTTCQREWRGVGPTRRVSPALRR